MVLPKVLYAYECVACSDIIYSPISLGRQPTDLIGFIATISLDLRKLYEHVGKASDGLYFFCGKRRLAGAYSRTITAVDLHKLGKSIRAKKTTSRHAKRNRVRRKAVAKLAGR